MGFCGSQTSPHHSHLESGELGVRWWCEVVVLTWSPGHPFSFSYSSQPILTPSLEPIGGCPSFVFGRVSNSKTIFNHSDFNHNTIFRSYKRVQIIVYILYIHENVSTLLFWAIVICEFGYVIISLRVKEFPFISDSAIYTTKQPSHSQSHSN